MFVKICGITRMKDAELAVELGASALGFVFWSESSRFIKPADAALIIEHLPARTLAVGVFVNEDAKRVNEIGEEIRLSVVQLHGDETPEYVQAMTLPVIRAVPLRAPVEDVAVSHVPQPAIVLLDVADPARRGGTGETVDWDAARAIARERTTILAGGLHAGNVGEAISRVQPHGVDVSSGVESKPGIKDADRMKAFFTAVGRATLEMRK